MARGTEDITVVSEQREKGAVTELVPNYVTRTANLGRVKCCSNPGERLPTINTSTRSIIPRFIVGHGTSEEI